MTSLAENAAKPPVMTRAHKVINLIGVPLPLVGLIAAIVLLWDKAVGPLELALLISTYVITCLGVTLGYHRLFTHRAFEASRAFKAAVAVVGSMAVQGSVITWVADHRKHHAFTDQDGDPHSPHLSGPGFWGAVKGLWHAHVGWLFESVGTADRQRFAGDLVKDRALRVVDKLFGLWVVLSFAIPFALGWIIGGGIGAALTALLWGGFVRVFLLHHVTWSINSICHFFGRKRFDIEDESIAQRVLARAAVDGRVLAPQPPRLPDLGVPRSALVGAPRRSDRPGDRGIREAGAGVERRPGQPGASAGQGAAVEATGAQAGRQQGLTGLERGHRKSRGVEPLPVVLGVLARSGPDDRLPGVVDLVRVAVAIGQGQSGDHAAQGLRHVIERVEVVVEDDHPPDRAKPTPGSSHPGKLNRFGHPGSGYPARVR
jgi:stearoyl-CoA desaturase (delta-9 desaturase)